MYKSWNKQTLLGLCLSPGGSFSSFSPVRFQELSCTELTAEVGDTSSTKIRSWDELTVGADCRKLFSTTGKFQFEKCITFCRSAECSQNKVYMESVSSGVELYWIWMDRAWLNWRTSIVCKVLPINVIDSGSEINSCFLWNSILIASNKSCQKNKQYLPLQVLQIEPYYGIAFKNTVPL